MVTKCKRRKNKKVLYPGVCSPCCWIKLLFQLFVLLSRKLSLQDVLAALYTQIYLQATHQTLISFPLTEWSAGQWSFFSRFQSTQRAQLPEPVLLVCLFSSSERNSSWIIIEQWTAARNGCSYFEIVQFKYYYIDTYIGIGIDKRRKSNSR